jgi:hypothetical protein
VKKASQTKAVPRRIIRRSGKRFADKIMRHFNKLARDSQISVRNLRKLDCGAKPVSTFADRALRGHAQAGRKDGAQLRPGD